MSWERGLSYVASGSINPAVFVKLTDVGGTTDATVTQAGSGDEPNGISQQAMLFPPLVLPGGSTNIYPTYAATTGQVLEVYGLSDICLLTAGSGGFNSGDHLAPDSNGAGLIVATGVGSKYYAIAQQTVGSAALGKVQVAYGTC